MAEPEYTKSWFKSENFNRYLKKFKEKNALRFLEIGSFEGESANYLVDNF